MLFYYISQKKCFFTTEILRQLYSLHDQRKVLTSFFFWLFLWSLRNAVILAKVGVLDLNLISIESVTKNVNVRTFDEILIRFAHWCFRPAYALSKLSSCQKMRQEFVKKTILLKYLCSKKFRESKNVKCLLLLVRYCRIYWKDKFITPPPMILSWNIYKFLEAATG